jgi:hypothetical protein
VVVVQTESVDRELERVLYAPAASGGSDQFGGGCAMPPSRCQLGRHDPIGAARSAVVVERLGLSWARALDLGQRDAVEP